MKRFRSMNCHPSAAHATIYTLKPEASDSDASQARAPESGARDRAVHEEGLISVARIGGGEMFRIIADPDFLGSLSIVKVD